MGDLAVGGHNGGEGGRGGGVGKVVVHRRRHRRKSVAINTVDASGVVVARGGLLAGGDGDGGKNPTAC